VDGQGNVDQPYVVGAGMLHDQIDSSLILCAIKLLFSCCLNIRWHSWPVTYNDLRKTTSYEAPEAYYGTLGQVDPLGLS
jgi:hypothetical protein